MGMDKSAAAQFLHRIQGAMSLVHGPLPVMLAPAQIEHALSQLEQGITSHVDVKQVIAIAKAACDVIGPVCSVVSKLEWKQHLAAVAHKLDSEHEVEGDHEPKRVETHVNEDHKEEESTTNVDPDPAQPDESEPVVDKALEPLDTTKVVEDVVENKAEEVKESVDEAGKAKKPKKAE